MFLKANVCDFTLSISINVNIVFHIYFYSVVGAFLFTCLQTVNSLMNFLKANVGNLASRNLNKCKHHCLLLFVYFVYIYFCIVFVDFCLFFLPFFMLVFVVVYLFTCLPFFILAFVVIFRSAIICKQVRCFFFFVAFV